MVKVSTKSVYVKSFLLAFTAQACFAIVLFLLYGEDVFTHPDTASYIAPALELRGYGRFYAGGVPEIVRTPGYPLFLSFFVRLPDWKIWVVVAQCVLAASVAVMTYELTRILWNAKAAAFATVLYVLSPLTLLYSSALLTERLSSFLLALICVVMLFYIRTCANRWLAVAGFLVAALAFVRPVAVYAPLGCVFFIVVRGITHRKLSLHMLAGALLFVVCALAPVKLWELRNERLTGYGGFSAISSLSLYFYNAGGVLAAKEGVSFPAMLEKMGYYDHEIFSEKHPEVDVLPRNERYLWMAHEGRRIIWENIGIYLGVHVKGMFFTLAMPATGILVRMSWDDDQPGFRKMKEGLSLPSFVVALFQKMPWTVLILGSSALLLFMYYIFAMYGFLGAWSRNWLLSFFMLGIIFYFVLVSGGPAATCRFRDPFAFLFAVWAGIGIAKIVWRKDDCRNVE